MDKNKVIENIFISPIKKMNFDWNGKNLDVEFAEPLDSNTTYFFVIGTEYNDLKGNKPNDAFSIVFSTGNKLDSGKIQGIIADEKPEGTYVIAYKIDEINPDTLNINHTAPAYKTQAGMSGKFEFQALKDGTYRIFIFKKKEKVSVYEEGNDQFGTVSSDVKVENGTSKPIMMKIGRPIDKVKPGLFTAEGLFKNQAMVSFSEPIDTFSIKNESFILTDSLGKFIENASGSFISKKSATQIILNFTKLEKDLKYIIKVNTDNSIKDTVGNAIDDTINAAKFYSVGINDTLAPALNRINLKDSLTKISLNPDFRIGFSSSIDTAQFLQRIALKDNKKSDVPFEINFINSNYLKIAPKVALNNEEWYNLKLDLKGLKSISGISIKKDTVLKYSFKTEDRRAYSKVSGKIKTASNYDGSYVIEMINKETKHKLITKIKTKDFIFEDVPAGDYIIWGYQDSDNNGNYSSGYSFPFKFAEKFSLIKEISVKSRWNLENLIIDIE